LSRLCRFSCFSVRRIWHLGPSVQTVKCRSCTLDNASPRITRREIEIFRITGLVLTASIVVSIIALSARRLVNMAYDPLRGGRRRRTESCFRGRLLRGIQLLNMRSSRMGPFCIESAHGEDVSAHSIFVLIHVEIWRTTQRSLYNSHS
jgi:hypothetical protein